MTRKKNCTPFPLGSRQNAEIKIVAEAHAIFARTTNFIGNLDRIQRRQHALDLPTDHARRKDLVSQTHTSSSCVACGGRIESCPNERMVGSGALTRHTAATPYILETPNRAKPRQKIQTVGPKSFFMIHFHSERLSDMACSSVRRGVFVEDLGQRVMIGSNLTIGRRNVTRQKKCFSPSGPGRSGKFRVLTERKVNYQDRQEEEAGGRVQGHHLGARLRFLEQLISSRGKREPPPPLPSCTSWHHLAVCCSSGYSPQL